jgi:DNA modification methylase
VILRYTQPGDLVLDQFLGSGTTMVEARFLGRRGIGVDINRDAVMLAHDRLNFTIDETTKKEEDADELEVRTGAGAARQWGDLKPKPKALGRPSTSSSSSPSSSLSSSASSGATLGEIQLYCGDARDLDAIKAESVDLIATHPPYAGIIKYTGDRVPGDLSAERGLDGFLKGMRGSADESFRVLKPGKHCAVLIGDTRKHKHYVPIAFRVMQTFLDAGFVLREDIIKLQHNMKTTREKWRGSKYDFYLLAHEHLFVFRKLAPDVSESEFKLSRKWWGRPAE